MKKHTVTIGIPAYNEEQNIGHLLDCLINQDKANFQLDKIIVSSDNSNDDTVKISKKYKHGKVKVIDNKVRLGQAGRQNQIISQTSSDILVLLNSDILIEGDDYIWKLIQPIVENGADLTSSNLKAMPPKSFVGKMLNITLDLRNSIYEKHKSGQNIYTCHGAARSFSRKFYKKFVFESSTAEDAFSYLFCISSGHKYQYVSSAVAYIRWPETLKDHYNQSLRFFQSKEILYKSFGINAISDEYRLPKSQILSAIIRFFLSHPIEAVAYTSIFLYSAISSLFVKPVNTWKVSGSSKKLI